MIRIALLILALLFSGLTFAGTGIDRIVKAFQDTKSEEILQQRNSQTLGIPPQPLARSIFRPECDPELDLRSCIDRACEFVGAYNCDSVDEIKQIGEACRGNYNSQCIESACARVGTYGCDSVGEIKQIGAACRGNYNNLCLDTACNYVGAFGCDTVAEISRIASGCMGNRNSECIEAVCARVGRFACDSVDEIYEIAKACSDFPG